MNIADHLAEYRALAAEFSAALTNDNHAAIGRLAPALRKCEAELRERQRDRRNKL